ncbi:unnamed protein product [Adineta ricciae]|uniref:F-box domain-containing protein n=1 Tax=Adineta ricciae TaxID=249248 RepID=A0A815SB60_ADIRI|nr:unnamed protein product [Adineta ricciae]
MTEQNQSEVETVSFIPDKVLDNSSQYGSLGSQYYNLDNICTQPQVYPAYGDSTNALVFRTYGPWWINLPSYRATTRQFKRPEKEFTSRDFIEIEYPALMLTCLTIDVYETYNPGSLEAAYVGKEDGHGKISWHRVWKFPDPFSIVLKNGKEIFIENGRQQMHDIFPQHVDVVTSALQSLQLNTDHTGISKIYTRHTYPPAARIPRITKIPLKGKVPFPTRHVRLEFDHCTANYYIEIDTIMLTGQRLKDHSTPVPIVCETKREEHVEDQSSMDLTKLPFDILFQICSYLDLRSLARFASTSRYFQRQCLDSLQFKSLNLQPYWNTITNDSIECFFSNYCEQTWYLSLAWTRNIQLTSFTCLLNKCSRNLRQLNLACCQYLTKQYIEVVVDTCPNIEILNLDACGCLESDDFLPLTKLTHLRSLNVYRTAIDFRTLLPLINQNKEHLEHLNLGNCLQLIDVAGIVRLLFARCSNLRSLDLWRLRIRDVYGSIVGIPYDLTDEEDRLSQIPSEYQDDLVLIYSLLDMPVATNPITHMKRLSEIDFGWTDPPAGFIEILVQQAGHSLIKIVLTACRHVSDKDIIAISENCPKLRQLDLLDVRAATEENIEQVLKRCPHLEFLDISFGANIPDAVLEKWIHQYKNCFKRTYPPIDNPEIYHEFA